MFTAKKDEPTKTADMQIIAHRGGAGLGLENTLSCIENGITAGATIIEIDIHLTADGQLLVCHDQTVDRTTNGTGKIREMTLPEIRELNIVDREGNITPEKMPSLDEVLDLVNGRAKLLIEIKRTRKIYRGIEQKLIDKITEHQAAEWVIVQSFNDSVLKNIHAINPHIRLEKLIIFKFPALPFIFDGSFTHFNFQKYSYISSFNIFYQAASRHFVSRIHHHRSEVKIWTLNNPAKMPDITVEGIITDRPDLWINP